MPCASPRPARLNQPCPIAALAAAGITVTLLDRAGAARALANPHDRSGAHSFLTNEVTEAIPGWKNPSGLERMTEADIAVAISDPEGRLAGIKFQTAYGETVSSNGWSHFEISPRKRFSIYRLGAKPTDDLKLMCWLVTPKSPVKSRSCWPACPCRPRRSVRPTKPSLFAQ